MWHDSICNTVQEPTVTSIIVAKKTAAWRESGFPSEFLAALAEISAAYIEQSEDKNSGQDRNLGRGELT